MMYLTEFMPKRLQKAGIFEAIDWIMMELDLPENTHISIQFNSKLVIQDHASVIDLDDDEEDGVQWYEIEINSKLPADLIIRSIFHEMIHIKQLSTGRLRYIKGVPHWLGKPHLDTPYNRQPWEIEAYDKEEIYLHRYREKCHANTTIEVSSTLKKQKH